MSSFTRLLGFLTKYWKGTALAIGSTVTVTALNLLGPIITGRIIDTILVSPEIVRENYNVLVLLSASLVGITALTGALNFAQRYVGQYIGQRVAFDIRNTVFSALQEKSFSFYDKTRTGELMSRVTGDVDGIRMFLQFGVRMLIGTFLGLGGAILMMLSMNLQLTLISLAIFPFIFLISIRMAKLIRPSYARVRQILGRMNTVLQEGIVGIKVIRVFAREDFEIERFNRINEEYTEANRESIRLMATYRPLMTLMLSIGTAIIYIYGGSSVISGGFSLGSLVAFDLFILRLTMPMRFLGMAISFMQNALVGADRVFEIIDMKSDVEERENAIILPSIEGRVSFNNVSFEYLEGKKVLKEINLLIKPRETVALVGGTGSGKSTLTNLIPRFYDVSEGSIEVDGRDVRDVTLKSLRGQIGIVPQETFLFSTTIRENMVYGKPSATMDEVIRAAKMAQAHDFIESFPDGYNTLVGERGVTLSGGQKQRIAIARAILSDPKILIFDDSTSSVDVETEHEIQTAIRNLLKDRTTFIITQRLSTIKNADRIVVLENGEIIEEGSHEELIVRDGVYATIYRTQYAPQEMLVTGEGMGGE